MNRTYIIRALFLVLSFSQLSAQTGGDAIIYTEQYLGEKIEYFFFDIKQNLNSISDMDKAEDLYIDNDMNGIRVSILGNDKDGFRAHPEAGVVVADYYANMINSIENARTARGDKDFYIFASKKMSSEASFPDWTKDENGVIVSQYVIMLSDYLRYMKYKGVEVDYLGIQNEEVYNEGLITAAKHADIIDSLRVRSTKEGWKMPKIVGYEDFGPNKTVISGQGSFISNLSSLGKTDRMDIYGTHYYPAWRPLSNLQKDQAYLGDMPFWSTEPHWDSKSDVHDFDEAIPAIMTLWDQVEQRMSGFMWWAYSYYSTTSLRANLMHAFSAPLKGSQAVRMDDIDGPFRKGVQDYDDLETFAFRGNGKLTVYVLNNTDNVYTDYGFTIDKGSIASPITCTQWIKDGNVLGEASGITDYTSQRFEKSIPANSISAFSFLFDDGTTAINKTEVDRSLKIIPSHSTHTINIQKEQLESYSIYNIAGILMHNGKEKELNISNWEKGVYILKTTSGKTARFTKQ